MNLQGQKKSELSLDATFRVSFQPGEMVSSSLFSALTLPEW